jgi:hypothetical protein
MVVFVVDPFFFIDEIMYFHNFFHSFYLCKIQTYTETPSASGNLKANHPRKHKHITLRMNGQILISTQLQWKKMNRKKMM